MKFRILAYADAKPAAIAYVKANFADIVDHIYPDLEDLIAGRGHCAIHGHVCEIEGPIDLVVAGLSCHPFAPLRHTKGNTADTSKAEKHSEFSVVFDKFPRFLERQAPLGFVVEEIPAFYRDQKNGDNYGKDFMEICSTKGFSQRCTSVDARVWIDWPRSRFVNIGAKRQLGISCAPDTLALMEENTLNLF
jgi:site-specific DNA-cytosine methylase